MMVILFVCFQSKNARYQILCMIAFFVNLNYKPFKLLASCFFYLTVLSATLFILLALELSGAVSDKSAVSVTSDYIF